MRRYIGNVQIGVEQKEGTGYRMDDICRQELVRFCLPQVVAGELTGSAEYIGRIACEVSFAERLQDPIDFLSLSFEVEFAT